MKTIFNKSVIKITYLFFILVTVLITISCSKDDKPIANNQLSISFNPSDYETTLFEAGESSPLELDSNMGEPESINILNPHDNIVFDGSTGKLRWDEGLPLGLTTVTVKAVKGATEATTQVTINNLFELEFAGGVNNTDENDPVVGEYYFRFNSDGTFSLQLGANPDSTPGTYTLNENTNHIVFSHISGSTLYIYDGFLTYSSGVPPKISGDLYVTSVSPANRQGYFEINWSN